MAILHLPKFVLLLTRHYHINMTQSEIQKEIIYNISKVLAGAFPNDYEKQKIHNHPDRLNFACPVCGDSTSDTYRKRGNMYWSSMKYHCYNCGYHTNLNTLLEQFDNPLTLEYKLNVIDIQKSSPVIKTNYNTDTWVIDILNKIGLKRDVFMSKLKLVEVDDEKINPYIVGRKIPKQFYKNFAYAKATNELYVLNLVKDDKVVSYQVRSLKENATSKYLTFNVSKMYQRIYNKNFEDILEYIFLKYNLSFEPEHVNTINKISMLFNITRINFNKLVYVCEGPIDSFFVDNCMALCGANKLNNYFDDIENICYIFDNDNDGKKHTFEKLSNGKYVFLWGKYISENFIACKIKDINDLHIKLDVIPNYTDEKYMSANPVDVVYV